MNILYMCFLEKWGGNCTAYDLNILNLAKYSQMNSSQWFHQPVLLFYPLQEVYEMSYCSNPNQMPGYTFDSGNFPAVKTCINLIKTVFSVEDVAFDSRPSTPHGKMMFLLGKFIHLCLYISSHTIYSIVFLNLFADQTPLSFPPQHQPWPPQTAFFLPQ